MDQSGHTFSFGHYHQVPGASCGILYILVVSLVRNPYIPFLIYEIFNLLVIYSKRKKKFHINGSFNGAPVPVHAPFSSRSSPVRYNWLSRSCFCAVCPFFALLNF